MEQTYDENNCVFKSPRGFTVIDNSIIRDRNISLKAKGLYMVIRDSITRPGVNCTKTYFLSVCYEGKKSFDSAWDELKNAGATYIANTTADIWNEVF